MATNPNAFTGQQGGFFNGATELAQYLTDQGKAIQKAETEAKNTITEIDGAKFYWSRNNERYIQMKPEIPADDPAPKALEFFTLDGLVDYIKANTEGLIPTSYDERLIVHVIDQRTVCLLSKPTQHQKVRNYIAFCAAHTPEIRYERYMDTESFNTMLLSNFMETPAKAELFKVIKSMTKEQNLNTTDDGVSQVITVKQGVSLAANVQFQNPVPLKPMRTFTEVDQPESNFTLRVNESAQAALFEADGGAWKNKAVANIKAYLQDKLKGENVVILA